MSKVRMIALRHMYYDHDLKPGEAFEATEEHAALLERTKAAEREPKAKKEYKTRHLEAEK